MDNVRCSRKARRTLAHSCSSAAAVTLPPRRKTICAEVPSGRAVSTSTSSSCAHVRISVGHAPAVVHLGAPPRDILSWLDAQDWALLTGCSPRSSSRDGPSASATLFLRHSKWGARRRSSTQAGVRIASRRRRPTAHTHTSQRPRRGSLCRRRPVCCSQAALLCACCAAPLQVRPLLCGPGSGRKARRAPRNSCDASSRCSACSPPSANAAPPQPRSLAMSCSIGACPLRVRGHLVLLLAAERLALCCAGASGFALANPSSCSAVEGVAVPRP